MYIDEKIQLCFDSTVDIIMGCVVITNVFNICGQGPLLTECGLDQGG